MIRAAYFKLPHLESVDFCKCLHRKQLWPDLGLLFGLEQFRSYLITRMLTKHFSRRVQIFGRFPIWHFLCRAVCAALFCVPCFISVAHGNHHYATVIIAGGPGDRFGFNLLDRACSFANRVANESSQTTRSREARGSARGSARGAEHSGLRCVVLSSTSAVFDLQRLRRGEVDFVVLRGDLAYAAFHGNGVFALPYPELRVVAALPPVPLRIASRPGLQISRLSDLLGLRVALGEGMHASSRGGNTLPSEERVLATIVRGQRSWNESNFATDLRLGRRDALAALCAGQLDLLWIFAWDLAPPCEYRVNYLSAADINLLTSATSPTQRHAQRRTEYVVHTPRTFDVRDLRRAEQSLAESATEDNDVLIAEPDASQPNSLEGVIGKPTLALQYFVVAQASKTRNSHYTRPSEAARRMVIEGLVGLRTTTADSLRFADGATMPRPNYWAPVFTALPCVYCSALVPQQLKKSTGSIPYDRAAERIMQRLIRAKQ